MLESAPGDPNRLGRDAQPAHVERLHRVPETHPLVSQQVLCREPQLLERDGDGVRGPQAHFIFGLPRTIARRVRGHNEGADAPLAAGDHHHQVRRAAVRRPRLRARQHPVIALPHRPRAQRRGVRARVGLGQREAAQPLAARHRPQPALLLRRRAVAQQHRRGDRAVDTHGHRDARVRRRQLLQRQQIGDRVEPHAAVLLGHRHPEEAEPAQLVDHIAREMLGAVPLRRLRLDARERELPRQIDDLALRLGEPDLNHGSHRTPARSSAPAGPRRRACGAAARAGTCRRPGRGAALREWRGRCRGR